METLCSLCVHKITTSGIKPIGVPEELVDLISETRHRQNHREVCSQILDKVQPINHDNRFHEIIGLRLYRTRHGTYEWSWFETKLPHIHALANLLRL